MVADSLRRLVYFIEHPSDYVGLWTLDATVLFSAATLFIVVMQLRLMKRQTALMVRQTAIMTAQDELTRALLARRTKLRMCAMGATGKVVVTCVNDGNKTAQNFYWHLAIPTSAPASDVWDGLGNLMLSSVGTWSQGGQDCRLYSGLVGDPLYPTRETPLARFYTSDPKVPIWWSTVSEDGAEPPEVGHMHAMERRDSSPTL